MRARTTSSLLLWLLAAPALAQDAGAPPATSRLDAGATVPRGDGGLPASTPDAGPATSLLLEADAHLAEERFADAARTYAAVLTLDPRSAEAHFKRGVALAASGDTAAAIPHWEEARVHSTDAAVQQHAADNIARARARLSAQADAGAANHASARAAYEAGVQRMVARDYAGALPLLDRALALEPRLALAHVARGGALLGLRRFEEALADYEAALRLAPHLAAPHFGLGEANRGLGRTAAARAAYARYAASTAPDARPELQADARRKADALR